LTSGIIYPKLMFLFTGGNRTWNDPGPGHKK